MTGLDDDSRQILRDVEDDLQAVAGVSFRSPEIARARAIGQVWCEILVVRHRGKHSRWRVIRIRQGTVSGVEESKEHEYKQLGSLGSVHNRATNTFNHH